MRHSRLQELLAAEFGGAYAVTLLRDHVLAALGGRTGEQALASGIPPRQVWAAICADFDVPTARRFGRDRLARPDGL